MRSAIELISSLFIILFPYSAVSLVLIAQTEQSPWADVSLAPVLGEGGGAVLVHLPIEAERYENGLAIVRTEDAVEVSPVRTAAIPADARVTEAARASEAPPPSASVAGPPAIVAARRLATAGEVTPIDTLEPVVTRSGNRTLLMAAKP